MSFVRRTALLLGLASIAVSGGCVTNDISLVITEFVPLIDGACGADPASMTLVSRGVYDVGVGSGLGLGYTVGFIVKNNLSTMSGVAVDTQVFFVESYDVELEVPTALQPAIPIDQRSFNVPTATARIAPAGAIGTHLPVFTPKQVLAMASIPDTLGGFGDLLVHIRPIATRAEEQHTFAAATFPLEVCNGCLSGGTLGRSCAALPAKGSPYHKGNSCNLAADEAVDCCVNAGQLFCGTDIEQFMKAPASP